MQVIDRVIDRVIVCEGAANLRKPPIRRGSLWVFTTLYEAVWSVLQYVAVCCSVLQCVAVRVYYEATVIAVGCSVV